MVCFENYVPTILGAECVWKDDLERIVAEVERTLDSWQQSLREGR